MTLEAKKKTKTEFAGSGCLVQGVGLLLPFIGAVFGAAGVTVGIVLGIVLLIAGSRMAQYWICGHCRNRLSDGGVKLCPVCKAALS